MPFNSLGFLLFFSVVFALFAVSFRQGRRPLLLAASYVFYYLCSPSWAHLLLFCTATSYLAALALSRAEKQPTRIAILWAAVLACLAPLAFYRARAAEGFHWDAFLLGAHAVPVGLSFFALQAVSYVVDVYRKVIQAEQSCLSYALYWAFFPKLIAGPIERAGALLPQLKAELAPRWPSIASGARLFLYGLSQKLVVADRLALEAVPVLREPALYPRWQLALACYGIALFILFDFMAYSHMAKGIAAMLGIRLSENFQSPYTSLSVREFWSRWHVTLGKWLRDYVFFPLQMGRLSAVPPTLALLAVFLLSGLWHGSSATFLAWGLYHGLGVALLDPLARRLAAWIPGASARRALLWLLTFHFVAVGWIFFFSGSLANAWDFFRALAVNERGGAPYVSLSLGLVVAFAALCETIERLAHASGHGTQAFLDSRRPLARWALCLVFAYAILFLGDFNGRGFVYLQF
jgi:alginate O-acetyltransferase complex protein AlgI